MRGSNYAFKRAGIENLLRRDYRLERGLLDVHSVISSNLSMGECWQILKPKVLLLWRP